MSEKKLTVEEMYEAQPHHLVRNIIIFTIVLILVIWSRSGIDFNGVSQGVRKRNSQDFPAAGLHWNVRLAKGRNVVRAVAGDLSDEVEWQYQTEKWGKPCALKMSVAEGDGQSSEVLVTAELIDKDGIRCLDSRDWIEFGLVGDGHLVENQGTSTGSRKIQAYNGRAMIRVMRSGKSIVSAVSPGIKSAFINIE